jgi:hypothetical protein
VPKAFKPFLFPNDLEGATNIFGTDVDGISPNPTITDYGMITVG